MLERQLERMSADPASVDTMAYMDVVRSGAEAGLVADVARFRDYREKRNITSRTYDAAQAEKIAAVLGPDPLPASLLADVREAFRESAALRNQS